MRIEGQKDSRLERKILILKHLLMKFYKVKVNDGEPSTLIYRVLGYQDTLQDMSMQMWKLNRHLSIYLSIHLSIYLSIHLSIYIYICLSDYILMYLPIYLSFLLLSNYQLQCRTLPMDFFLKKKEFEKRFILAFVTPGVLKGSLKTCQPIGSSRLARYI